MARIPITRVRLSEEVGFDALRRYVFSGRYGGVRVPRGVPETTVAEFIRKEINDETEVECFPRALDVMRFYETSAAIPSLLRLLVPAPSHQALPKTAAVVEITGDLGNENQAREAADYLENRIIPHPSASAIPTQVLAACVGLSSVKCTGKFSHRLEAERDQLEAASTQSEQGLRDYAKISALVRNNLPQTGSLIAAKLRISTLDEAARIPELVAIYLRRSPFSSGYMDTWSGRFLRKIASNGGDKAVYDAFETAMKDAVRVYGAAQADFSITRAAQAIIYLQGELSREAKAWYAQVKDKALNFLWDDE